MKERQILDEVLGQSATHNNELLYSCPKCSHHKRKLSVNLNKGVFKCWVCEFSGKNIGYLVRKYGNDSQFSRWLDLRRGRSHHYDITTEATPEEELTLPEGFVTLCTASPGTLHRPALNYAANRGITMHDVFKWKLGFSYKGRHRNRIIVPSFDASGKLDYYVARSFTDNPVKYLNPRASKDIIFNDLMIDWSKPITIVEGAFDAMKMENSIPILGSTLPVYSKLFQKILNKNAVVYIALDNDARRKEEKIIKISSKV